MLIDFFQICLKKIIMNKDFKIIQYMDLKLVVHTPTKMINYTRLCKDLKKSTDHNIFRKMISNNSRLWEIIIRHELNKKIQSVDDFIGKPRNIQTLIDLDILHNFKRGMSPKYFGTYGPQYLLMFIIFNYSAKHYDRIVNEMIYWNCEIYEQSKQVNNTGIELPIPNLFPIFD